ncbi:MAG: hypothetical protein P4M02_05545 [Clostridia bacterium]|nr:hypothetical protein [Clostridia bacterium]
MLNTKKIEERMAELGLTMPALTELSGIRKPALERIIHNQSGADTVVTEQLRVCLRLEGKDAGEYFFCNDVAFRATSSPQPHEMLHSAQS